MSIFGLIEENMELSHIHLAVPKFKMKLSTVQWNKEGKSQLSEKCTLCFEVEQLKWS